MYIVFMELKAQTDSKVIMHSCCLSVQFIHTGLTSGCQTVVHIVRKPNLENKEYQNMYTTLWKKNVMFNLFIKKADEKRVFRRKVFQHCI